VCLFHEDFFWHSLPDGGFVVIAQRRLTVAVVSGSVHGMSQLKAARDHRDSKMSAEQFDLAIRTFGFTEGGSDRLFSAMRPSVSFSRNILFLHNMLKLLNVL
jgi:hypothetical protein